MASIPLLLSLIVRRHKHRVLQPALRRGEEKKKRRGAIFFPLSRLRSIPGQRPGEVRGATERVWGRGDPWGAAAPRLSRSCPWRWCRGFSRWLSPGPSEARVGLCGHPEICHRPSLPSPGGSPVPSCASFAQLNRAPERTWRWHYTCVTLMYF